MKPIFLVTVAALQHYLANTSELDNVENKLSKSDRARLSDRIHGFAHYQDYRITSLGAGYALSLRTQVITPTIRIEEGILLNPGYWPIGKFPNIVTPDFVALTRKQQKEVIDNFVIMTLDKRDELGYLPYSMGFRKTIFGSSIIEKMTPLW